MVWSADYTNDPTNDYKLVVDVLCDDEIVGMIKRNQNDNELEIIWFSHNDDFCVPSKWLMALLSNAEKSIE